MNIDYTNMTWDEIIKLGMTIIADGCTINKSFVNCEICPFESYCDAIQIGAEDGLKVDIPENWEH